jgi:L-arabinokinase
VRIVIRTRANPAIFDESLRSFVEPADIDFPVIEQGPLKVDLPATIESSRSLLARRDEIVSAEVAAVRDRRPALIVADIPFLAGDVADILGIPCVGVSNFSWDWILAPAVAPADAELLDAIGRGYARMHAVLSLPFGGVSTAFRQVHDVPLIALRSSVNPAQTLKRIGIDSPDGRPRVLVGLRGGVPAATLRAVAAEAPEFLFLHVDAHAAEAEGPNVRYVPLSAELTFADVLAASEVVVSKLGYGVVADSIAAGVRLVWPRREGFREDEVMAAEAPRHLRMTEMPIDDFHAGRWVESLEAAMASQIVEPTATNGAEVCAKYLDDLLADGAVNQ